MDRLTEGAVTAAVLVSLSLSVAACGGGSTAEPVAAPPPPAVQSIGGVTLPQNVSVVTAKNAQ